MKLQLSTKPIAQVKNNFVILPVLEGGSLECIRENIQSETLKQFLKDNPKFGKENEVEILYLKNIKLLLVGLGKKDKIDFEKLQNFAGTGAKYLLTKCKEASLYIPKIDKFTPNQIAEAVAIGLEIASHNPAEEFKSETEKTKLQEIELLVEKAEKGYQDGIKKGNILAQSINMARKLGDLPPNIMTPTYFLKQVQKIAKENKLKLTIVDEKKAKRIGLGAFVGVAQGSDEPSFLIALDYKGNLRLKDKWAIVGKGVTFDSGGISIKPSASMHEMKYDMCGAANALATILAVSKLGLKTNLVAVMAVTENLPSGKALKPGDILKTYCGKTAEILNTDAEGRVLLIDALAFAQKDLKATKLIDLATLTGAMIVSLGDFHTGVFSNNDKFAQDLISTGARVGEKFWQMPMSEEYNEMIKSDFADITNIGHGGSMPGAAGSITGAKFIEAGIEKNTPWIHLDIAGTAWDMKKKPYRSLGATGVGVKTLVELISSS